MKNNRNEFQQLVDRELSGLEWTNRHCKQVLESLEQKGEMIVRRKCSFAALALAVLLLFSAMAMASGMIFSQTYHAGKLANEALQEQYGISEEMLSFFRRDIREEEGKMVVEYTGILYFEEVLGTYTVTIEDGKAQVVWSLDGKEMDGGFDAQAWGAAQIQRMIDQVKETNGLGEGSQKALERAGEEQAPSFASYPIYLEMSEKAQSLAKIGEEEAKSIALDVLCAEYEKIAAKREKIEWIDTYYTMDGEVPVMDVSFWLWQTEDETFTLGNGIYNVYLNAASGEILDVVYDSALAGNG